MMHSKSLPRLSPFCFAGPLVISFVGPAYRSFFQTLRGTQNQLDVSSMLLWMHLFKIFAVGGACGVNNFEGLFVGLGAISTERILPKHKNPQNLHFSKDAA